MVVLHGRRELAIDPCTRLCSVLIPRSRVLEGVGALISFSFICSRVGGGCAISFKEGTTSPICVLGLLLLGVLGPLSSHSLYRETECSVSFGCFLKVTPRSPVISSSLLSGFEERELGSAGVLSLLVGGALSVTVRGRVPLKGAVVMSTARALSQFR